MNHSIYSVLADIILAAHVGYVAFVVVGLMVILLGGALGWSWVRNPWFRSVHLAAIALVVVQAWFGIVCPLTTLEIALREKAGDSVYSGTFIGHWLEQILFIEAPPWVFVAGYTLFGLAVVMSWVKIRPRAFRLIKS